MAMLADRPRDEAERRRFLTQLFDATARDYDRLTGFLSFGSGIPYRRDALRRAGLRRGMRVLDVAVGTGAIARGAIGIVGATGCVVGLDPSAGMLREARRKLALPLVQGEAERLPFQDGAFDFVSMGYALRHVSDLDRMFGEYARVLRPGGTLLVLEFARGRSRLTRGLNRLYLGYAAPWLSRVRCRSKAAQHLMDYCWQTVEHLVPPEEIVASMRRSGFDGVQGKQLFGLLSEYLGHRPEVPRRAVSVDHHVGRVDAP
jgi:demethylmenaquinone methyltransferase/2-methoxy-6-polyprenyl-1,4-benzoquinol methylase